MANRTQYAEAVNAVTCPALCKRAHNEGPGETVLHEGERTYFHALNGSGFHVASTQVEDERVLALVADYELAPVDLDLLISKLIAVRGELSAALDHLR